MYGVISSWKAFCTVNDNYYKFFVIELHVPASVLQQLYSNILPYLCNNNILRRLMLKVVRWLHRFENRKLKLYPSDKFSKTVVNDENYL